MNKNKRLILLSDRGWRQIRELSINLSRGNISSTVLIKGLPQKQVREMITKHRGIKNIFICEKFFSPFLFIYILAISAVSARGGLSVYASKEKTLKRLSVFKKLFSRIDLIRINGKK